MKRGVILIELAIGAALALTLILLIGTEFKTRRTQALVVETRRDLTRVAAAMEAYHADNGSYPASELHTPLDPRFSSTRMDDRLLTTPIAYLASEPIDPFRASLSGNQLWIFGYTFLGIGTPSYTLYPRVTWMAWGNGPDRTTQTGGYRSLMTVLANESRQTSLPSDGIRYDPSNGTVSIGDIYVFGVRAAMQ